VVRLRSRRSEIDEAIFARVSDQWFDRTGSNDPEYVAGLREAGVAALEYVFEGAERWGEFLEPVPTEVLEQARRAARVGVGLETVLRRYLAGYAVLERFVMQEAQRDRSPVQADMLGEALGILSGLVDRLVTAVSSAYSRETEWQGAEPSKAERGKEALGSGGVAAPKNAAGLGSLRVDSRVAASGTQRERVLQAIVEVVAERGVAGAPIGAIVERARVSRPTFYKLFPGGLEDGVVAVMYMGLERVATLASGVLEGADRWQDGMRAALAVVLAFFDAEPQLARVLMVQSLGGGPVVLEHRERTVEAFRTLIVTRIEEEVAEGEIPRVSPLTAEGVLASVMEIVRARLAVSVPEPQSLIGLLGPLMGLIVEHVADWRTAVQEERLGEELARAIQAGEVSWALPTMSASASTWAPAGDDTGLPETLADQTSTARRLRECVVYLARQNEHGSAPSNSAIGAAIGVAHKSQISKLLAQLLDEGLVVKRSAGAGTPNEWRLTERGEEIARGLIEHEGA
jgi:AcrR family transcriptional regulator